MDDTDTEQYEFYWRVLLTFNADDESGAPIRDKVFTTMWYADQSEAEAKLTTIIRKGCCIGHNEEPYMRDDFDIFLDYFKVLKYPKPRSASSTSSSDSEAISDSETYISSSMSLSALSSNSEIEWN